MAPTTTLAKLHAAGACEPRYRHLCKSLGGVRKYGRNTPITLLQILDICGLDDALWALRACDNAEAFSRETVCRFAERVLPIYEAKHPSDDRPRKCIETARRYACGAATSYDLMRARAAADAAAFNTAAAADAAAFAAAFAASTAAAASAAAYAASAAADAAAATASKDEREAQEHILRDMIEEH